MYRVSDDCNFMKQNKAGKEIWKSWGCGGDAKLK